MLLRSPISHLLMMALGNELFRYSASGTIITETMAATMPTVIVYVVDTPRCASPVTFMSNMLYACSILYKARLPFVLAFNKTDVVSHEFAIRWMKDFTALQDSLGENTYMASLSRSMGLVLQEFYEVSGPNSSTRRSYCVRNSILSLPSPYHRCGYRI